MSMKWKLLQFGTRIKIKGDKDVEGTIIEYLTDEGETKGYIVKLDDGSYIIIDLDAEIEAIKQ